jgi:hypothetical protein
VTPCTAPYIPRQFDTNQIPNTLTQNDVVETGGHYREGAVPMGNYIFYGSNLPQYEPTTDEIGTSQKPEKPCPPFNCSPSLYELLQMSFDAVGSTTLNNISGSLLAPPPGHLDVISGPTIVEELGLDSVETCPREVMMRKDSKFRWSMLSAEKGQFDDALEDPAAQISHLSRLEGKVTVAEYNQQEAKRQGEEPTDTWKSGLGPMLESKTSSSLEAADHEIHGTHPGHEQEINIKIEPQPELEVKFLHQTTELATPIMLSAAVLASPPHQKAIHREAKLVVFNLNDSVAMPQIHNDINTILSLSRTSGHNKGNSTFETVPPSSLGLDIGGERGADVTGVTTVDFGISGPLGVCSSEGIIKASGIDCGNAVAPGEDAASDSDSAVNSGISSILGKLERATEPHSLLGPIGVGDDYDDNHGVNNVDSHIKSSDKGVESFEKSGITGGKIEVVSSLSQLDTGSLASQDDLVPFTVDKVMTLVKRIVAAVIHGVRKFISQTCHWRLVWA